MINQDPNKFIITEHVVERPKFSVECTAENARRFWDWLQTRGGIAVWKSVNLSNPSGSWSTPATIRRGDSPNTGPADDGTPDDVIPYPKPTWEADFTPKVYTDPKDVGVFTSEAFKILRVHLRQSGNGLSLKLTDASQRRVDKAMDECECQHGDAFYLKSNNDAGEPTIEIHYTTGIIGIAEWIKANEVRK